MLSAACVGFSRNLRRCLACPQTGLRRERLDTPETRAFLEQLAQGDPHNELTREAGRTLKRRAPEKENGAASGKK